MKLKHTVHQIAELKQNQLLMCLPHMQQAILLLQVPTMELAELIEQEVENNPLLEYSSEIGEGDSPPSLLEKENREEIEDEKIQEQKELSFEEEDFTILKQLDVDFKEAERGDDFTRVTQDDLKKRLYYENSITTPTSLNSDLIEQAHTIFENEEDFRVAEILIGHFNRTGLIEGTMDELVLLYGHPKEKWETILHEIQTQFDPPGIGGSSIQESLQIQLRRKNEKQSLGYLIVSNYYDDLIHNRLQRVQKALKCSQEDIQKAILQIAKLDFHPGSHLERSENAPIVPDVSIKKEGEEWIVDINKDTIPSLKLNRRYLRMLDNPTLSTETKDYIKKHLLSAKWLVKNIDQRNQTLHRLCVEIKKRQIRFFSSPDGELHPMTMKEVADALELHESTIARATANKYVDTPRGLLPLRSFFTNAYVNKKGEDLSQSTVRETIRKIIEEEDKNHPYSDDAISHLLERRGISCARRTVAKHRYELKMGNALQRRKYG